MSRTLARMFVGMALLTGWAWSAGAAVGTQFTYQGVLADGGTAADGTYDFRCLLYTADVGGSQVGSTLTIGAVAVSEGRVTLQLDFGDVFDGTQLWLELHVRATGSPSYSVLSPRQRIGPTPYAMVSDEAGAAAWAADAGQLDGQAPGYYLAWSNLTGVPAGLDDGDDDTLGGLSCADGDVATWSGSAWTCDPDDGSWASTYVVGPVGTATENGTALLVAVAALPAASESQPLLLKLEPGVYDVQFTTLLLPAWVDLEGSGRGSTTITGRMTGSLGTVATVSASGDNELRRLTLVNEAVISSYGTALVAWNNVRVTDVAVVSTGDARYPYAVYVPGNAVVMSDADITVLDGLSSGSRIAMEATGTDLELTRMSVSVSGGIDLTSNKGLGLFGGGELVLRDVDVRVLDSAGDSVGVWATGYSRVQVRDLGVTTSTTGDFGTALKVSVAGGGEIEVQNARCFASATSIARAVQISAEASATDGYSGSLGGIDAGATDASVRYGVEIATSSSSTTDTEVTISDSTMVGGIGLKLQHTGTESALKVHVRGSTILGDSYGIRGQSGNEWVLVGGSMISGGVSTTVDTCAGVWTDTYTFLSSTCP